MKIYILELICEDCTQPDPEKDGGIINVFKTSKEAEEEKKRLGIIMTKQFFGYDIWGRFIISEYEI